MVFDVSEKHKISLIRLHNHKDELKNIKELG